MWQTSDEALLQRLSDELMFERLWGFAAPGADALPSRASGMIRLLRDHTDAQRALDQATRGDLSALLEFLMPRALGGWASPLTHHLALFHRDRVEHGLANGGGDDVQRECSLIIACWLALACEGTYFESLAKDVFGTGARPFDIECAVRDAAFRGIEAVRDVARAGMEQHALTSASALRSLAHIDDAIAMANVRGELEHAARARAAAAKGMIIDELLAPLLREASELSAREWKPDEVQAWFTRVTGAWRWANEEVEIERLIVKELPRFAWDLYREKRWDHLRMLLTPIAAPTDRLAYRVEHDPQHLPWAAQSAQALVFRAELAPTLVAQLELAERAYRIAPALRNARLVLADLLCARVERQLMAPAPLLTRHAWTAARDDLERAAEIFPELSRLPGLRERLGSRGFK